MTILLFYIWGCCLRRSGVCVCYAVSQTGISFNVLRRRRRFFGLQGFLLNGETRTRSFGRLCSFGPSFCEEPFTGAGGEEELLHIWRRLLTGESWENTRLLRDSRCCFTKKMFLVWILVSYLCVCSAVVAVVVRTGLSPVLQLWKFCPNFLLKTFILFVLVHGLLRQRLIFPVKTKTFKKKIRNNNMWPYSTDLWFSSHQWFLKLGAETP